MSPLQKALRDAVAVGFDAPKCSECGGTGEILQRRYVLLVASRPCASCAGCGYDATDPRTVSARACLWLLERGYTISPDEGAAEKGTLGDRVSAERWLLRWRRGPSEDHPEAHDGTPEGLALALLRIVVAEGPKLGKSS